jgi:hypothetical protein
MKGFSTCGSLLASRTAVSGENVTGMLHPKWDGLTFAHAQRLHTAGRHPAPSVSSCYELNISNLFRAQPGNLCGMDGLTLARGWPPGSTSRSETFRRKNNRRYSHGHEYVPVRLPPKSPQLP